MTEVHSRHTHPVERRAMGLSRVRFVFRRTVIVVALLALSLPAAALSARVVNGRNHGLHDLHGPGSALDRQDRASDINSGDSSPGRNAGSKSPGEAIVEVERQPSDVRHKNAADDFGRGTDDEERPERDSDGHLRRTALRSNLVPPLPSPPVPSRVLPASLSRSSESARNQRRDQLPIPPAPSKIRPGPIPKDADSDSLRLDRSVPSEPN
jgi:hypothetical protein